MNIGIDLGGSHIGIGLVNENNEILAKKEHNWTDKEKENLDKNILDVCIQLIKQIMIENNIDYFSAWAYTSNEVWEGLPTVSMHTANLFYKMVGSEQLKVNTLLGNAYFIRGENKAVAAYDKESRTINIMAYNFIPNLDAPEAPEKIYYSGETVFSVKLPDDVKKVKITLTPVDDDCNYFDDWLDDMEKYNIPPEHFSWSPDSTNEGNLYHPESKEIFNSQRERYMECSRLNPTEYTADVIDGICTVTTHVPMNTVMFCTIEPIE